MARPKKTLDLIVEEVKGFDARTTEIQTILGEPYKVIKIEKLKDSVCLSDVIKKVNEIIESL